jgi:hypothetical protein
MMSIDNILKIRNFSYLFICFGVQVAQNRYGASSDLNIDVVGPCADFVLKELLRDDNVPKRLPTLSARLMEIASLLLWSSTSELAMAAEIWARTSNTRLRCKGRLLKVFGKAPGGASGNCCKSNIRMEPDTMHKMCSAAKTIFWVRSLI